MVKTIHQHQMQLRNVQKNMVLSQSLMRHCHVEAQGYQRVKQWLRQVLLLVQDMLYIEQLDLYHRLHHLFGGQYRQMLLRHN